MADPPVRHSPPPISGDFARVFQASKADFVIGCDGDAATAIRQTGGAYLDGPFELPTIEWELPGSEPLIETFVIDGAGTCIGTGSDQQLIDAWLPAVQQMSARIAEAMAELEVELAAPAYLTASVTMLDDVTNTPHFDDDQPGPDDGVGFVAIAGSHAGPCIAVEPVPCEPLRAGLPLEVAPSIFDRFAAGGLIAQQAEPNRIVVFPQFGQLHSGPCIEAENGAGSLRRLMVFRAQTVPVGEPDEVGDGPT